MKKLIFITFVLFSIGCKETSKTNTAKEPIPQQKQTHAYPTFPMLELKNIFENASYVDYIFHKLPFAISQDTEAGVKGNIAMISQKAPTNFDSSCPSIGREFFHIDGEIVWEAEIYFDIASGCAAYVFYKDKKPVFANGISDAGKKFYTNLINQSFK